MNIFASIEEVIAYRKVTYYTIRFEKEANSEFEKFILKHSNNNAIHDEYNDIMALIKRIGNKYGAKAKYFSRHEKKAQALPPDWNNLSHGERKLHIKYQQNLRLYCLRITDDVVFVFNGGIKTQGHVTAEDCNKVRKYFRSANILVAAIDEALHRQDIKLDGMRLEFEDDFELML